MKQNNRSKFRPILGGHRGHLSHIRENTIPNFEEVKKLNLSYIEIDVQLTKDQRAVIYHDTELSEKTDLSGMIREYTGQELRESFEICTLEEAVSWCRENSIGMALEIKLHPRTMWQDREVLAKEICAIIGRYDFYGQCFVFGKDYGMLSMIKNMNSRVYIGLIVPFVPEDPVKLMEKMRAVVYLNYADQLPENLVKELQEAGYWVDGSVVNSKEELRLAQELGVDLIESDHPEYILELLWEKNES